MVKKSVGTVDPRNNANEPFFVLFLRLDPQFAKDKKV